MPLIRTLLDRVDRGMAGQPEGNELRRELGRLREQVARLGIDLAERIDQVRALQQELEQRDERTALALTELNAARYAWLDNDRERMRTCLENLLRLLEREGQ